MTRMHLDLSPETIVWARESIGLTIEDAAKKIDVSTLDLRFWEEGVGGPTVNQLRNMARVYKRPIAAFLLEKPPAERDSLPDFRMLHDHQTSTWSPALHGAYRRAQFQRSVALEIFADEFGDPHVYPHVSLNDDPERAANVIWEWLGLRADSLTATDSLTNMKLGDLTYSIEKKRILVLQTQHISIKEMRGFSISEKPFPVIAINGGDASTARKFTLMHELTHVLLGMSSMCDLQDSRARSSSSPGATERFCNRLGAAVLMPKKLLSMHPSVVDSDPSTPWNDSTLRVLAEQFGVSEEAMLIRLVSLGFASEDFYWSKRGMFQARYQPDVTDRGKDEDDSLDTGKSGGPGYYKMKVRDYGRSFVLGVLAAYQHRRINAADVSSYLDIKYEQMPQLESVAER